MSDDPNESKAKKLAAARKKLKEYQKRSADLVSGMSTSTTSVASSEKSDLETTIDTPINAYVPNATNYFDAAPAHENAFDLALQDQPIEQNIPISAYFENNPSNNQVNVPNLNEHFTIDYQQQQHNLSASGSTQKDAPIFSDPRIPINTTSTVAETSQQQEQQTQQQQQHQMYAMELLINEKTQLTMELNRYRSMCHEQNTELEDLRAQVNASKEHIEKQQQSFSQYQRNQEQLSRQNAELMHKLSHSNAQQEDQVAHLEELQQQLKIIQNQFNQLDEKYKEKSKECELAQLRIEQLSCEPSTTTNSTDNRIEAMTQNQFMHEQQIRDLQAMVQQFSQDKEQSSTQYQNYVQHLNAEVASLNDRNSELTGECTQLQERERQLVEHISDLERELQKHLSQRQKQSENQQTSKEDELSNAKIEILQKQIEELQERLSDFEFERHEFQLKIKSQEDRLEELQEDMSVKEEQLEKMVEHMAEQPDQLKLLATMESDKVAASRALAQNVELKKQLDELELRFVQLTNDKAELTNKLDAEEFTGREMRTNYAAMEERIRTMDERFEYKDAEMIRLSHENMELTQEISNLQEKLNGMEEKSEVSNSNCEHEDIHAHSHDHDHEHNHTHDHDHKHTHGHDHTHSHDNTECNGDSQRSSLEPINRNTIKYSDSDSCEEARESDFESKAEKSGTPQIATAEAVEKLQTRFTYLMSQVADLTEEKQRLEHLVMQLQSETDTIGEYIALYQTQRRILKQREYEKAAQARLLQEEREVLRDKIGQLNHLVSRLGFLEKMPTLKTHIDNDIQEDVNSLAESISIEPKNHDYVIDEVLNHAIPTNEASNANHSMLSENDSETEKAFDIPETNEILMKIQNIVTEIRENATKEPTLTVDHCHCCEGQLKVV